jgi:hypothetical protein
MDRQHGSDIGARVFDGAWINEKKTLRLHSSRAASRHVRTIFLSPRRRFVACHSARDKKACHDERLLTLT